MSRFPARLCAMASHFAIDLMLVGRVLWVQAGSIWRTQASLGRRVGNLASNAIITRVDLDANIRTDARLDKGFVASIKGLGVLVPIIAVRDWLEYAKCTPLGTQPADACSFARRPSSDA